MSGLSEDEARELLLEYRDLLTVYDRPVLHAAIFERDRHDVPCSTSHEYDALVALAADHMARPHDAAPRDRLLMESDALAHSLVALTLSEGNHSFLAAALYVLIKDAARRG